MIKVKVKRLSLQISCCGKTKKIWHEADNSWRPKITCLHTYIDQTRYVMLMPSEYHDLWSTISLLLLSIRWCSSFHITFFVHILHFIYYYTSTRVRHAKCYLICIKIIFYNTTNLIYYRLISMCHQNITRVIIMRM